VARTHHLSAPKLGGGWVGLISVVVMDAAFVAVVEFGALVVVVAAANGGFEVGVGGLVVIALEIRGVACLVKKLTAAVASNSKKQHRHLYKQEIIISMSL
jgi:hypothetical protein